MENLVVAARHPVARCQSHCCTRPSSFPSYQISALVIGAPLRCPRLVSAPGSPSARQRDRGETSQHLPDKPQHGSAVPLLISPLFPSEGYKRESATQIPYTSRAGIPAARAKPTIRPLISTHLPPKLPVSSIALMSPRPQPGVSGLRQVVPPPNHRWRATAHGDRTAGNDTFDRSAHDTVRRGALRGGHPEFPLGLADWHRR